MHQSIKSQLGLAFPEEGRGRAANLLAGCAATSRHLNNYMGF